MHLRHYVSHNNWAKSAEELFFRTFRTRCTKLMRRDSSRTVLNSVDKIIIILMRFLIAAPDRMPNAKKLRLSGTKSLIDAKNINESRRTKASLMQLSASDPLDNSRYNYCLSVAINWSLIDSARHLNYINIYYHILRLHSFFFTRLQFAFSLSNPCSVISNKQIIYLHFIYRSFITKRLRKL